MPPVLVLRLFEQALYFPGDVSYRCYAFQLKAMRGYSVCVVPPGSSPAHGGTIILLQFSDLENKAGHPFLSAVEHLSVAKYLLTVPISRQGPLFLKCLN